MYIHRGRRGVSHTPKSKLALNPPQRQCEDPISSRRRHSTLDHRRLYLSTAKAPSRFWLCSAAEMMNRRLLLGWIWAIQLILAHADDITNWEQIITVVRTQLSYPLVPHFTQGASGFTFARCCDLVDQVMADVIRRRQKRTV